MDVEMIERVAEALYIADCVADKEPHDWKVLSQYSKDIYIDRSKAAIKAMREPTEKMIDAGGYTPSYNDGMIMDNTAKLCWQTMIDSITND